MFYRYVPKALRGETVPIRTYGPDQARVLAVAYYGKDYLHADIISIDNKEDK